jgi:PncC family amidohydrolase
MSGLFGYLWKSKIKQRTERTEYTVAVAESVTAGALANTLCSEPGASKFFKGGVVAYSIQSKKDILGIDIVYSEKNNFANAFTTAEMAKSVAKKFNARIGIATTGYSLPTYRDEDITKGFCKLDINHPYAFICLYDSVNNSEIVKRVNFQYVPEDNDKFQRASVQTKVALEGKKMYLTHKAIIESQESPTIKDISATLDVLDVLDLSEKIEILAIDNLSPSLDK